MYGWLPDDAHPFRRTIQKGDMTTRTRCACCNEIGDVTVLDEEYRGSICRECQEGRCPLGDACLEVARIAESTDESPLAELPF